MTVQSNDVIRSSENSYILINTQSNAIGFGRVRIYNEDFPSKKSLDPLIMWPCKVT